MNKPTAMGVGNACLFGATVSAIALEFVSILGLRIDFAGLRIHAHLVDAPLLFGLLEIVYSSFNFYKRIIEPRGESPVASLFSLFGMLVMTALPVVLFIPGFLQFRYLVLGLYGILVALKNMQLRLRFGGQRRALFHIWARRTAVQAAGCLVFGVILWLVLDPAGRTLLPWWLRSRNSVLGLPFEEWISSVANTFFLAVVSVAFVHDQRELAKLSGGRGGNKR